MYLGTNPPLWAEPPKLAWACNNQRAAKTKSRMDAVMSLRRKEGRKKKEGKENGNQRKKSNMVWLPSQAGILVLKVP